MHSERRHGSAKVSRAELDALESLMGRMDASPAEVSASRSSTSSPSRETRPPATTFPSRPTSSLSNSHPRPAFPGSVGSRSSSPSLLSVRSSSALSVRSAASATGSVTPSMGGAEWSSSSTPASPHRHPHDFGEPSTPPSANPGVNWSSPSSSNGPYPRSPAFAPASPASPGRLQPRSARNDRAPFEDLAFFREATTAGTSTDEYDGQGLRPRPRARSSTAPPRALDDDRVSTTVRASKRSSMRSLRLRQEIEQATNQLRASPSFEGLGVVLDRQDRPRPPAANSRASTGSGSLGPPTPSPASVERDNDDSETHSLASAASGASLPSLYSAGIWSQTSSMTSHGGLTPGLGYSAKESREREVVRPRQRELKEWSQACWTWQREKSPSHGMLSKTPLIREVPAAMKRKMGRRDSSQLLSADTNSDESKGKASKPSFGVGPTSSSKQGSWRKVTGVMRDDGYFRVFNEDTVILHSIHLPSVLRTDVRLVDPSLFGRPHCVVIHRRLGTPPTPGLQTRSSRPASLPVMGALRPLDEPLYICMPSAVATQSWLVMAHCFARPEFYTAAAGSLPQSPAYDHSKADRTDGDDDPGWDDDEQVDSRCRIFRSIAISINEGRGIGELGTEVVRLTNKLSYERRPDGEHREGSGSTAGSVDSFPIPGDAPSSSRASGSATMRIHRGDGAKDQSEGMDTFCEISLDGDALARTSIRKGTTSPFWNESFLFSDLPPITQPLTIKIFQTHKSSKPTLVGTSIVRVPDLPRAELVEDWWPVKPVSYDLRGKANETVGELSLTVKVDEEVVLPSSAYSPILELLNDDADAELASSIAHEFPADLEEVAKILLRVYQAEAQLLPRILRLAEQEIDGDVKSASILFRGNSILTKSVELYLRLVGAEYLELSIGEPVRRLCAEKVEIEIDPSKMKSGVREKDINNNVNTLREWTTEVWNRMYSAREKCPNEVRMIFAHIQRVVADKYGEEHKKMRSTSVSAFIFLRFFVPAVLNPKLFSLVPHPPDPKAQRSLTLVAKTLQGLANFSTFGQKEPWMFPMNAFVQDHTSAFVDFIDNISTPSPTARFEWTSPSSASYLSAYRLRNSLPPAVREGVPLLPHLIDLPRDLGLLASHMARAAYERGGPPTQEGRTDGTSTTSSRTSRSSRIGELSDRCVDVHEEAQRRGGGLVAPLRIRARGESAPSAGSPTKLRPRAATARGGSGWSGFSDIGPASPSPKRQESVEEIHIRAAPVVATAAPGSPQDSIASRRSHRSFTIGGNLSRTASLQTFPFISPSGRSSREGNLPDDGNDTDTSAMSPIPLEYTSASESLSPVTPSGEISEPEYSFPPRASKPPEARELASHMPPASPTSVETGSSMSLLFLPHSASSSSVAMSQQASTGSNATSTSTTSTRSSQGGTSASASAGRKPSTTGSMGIMQSLMGDDPLGEGRKRTGLFKRKNSRAGPGS